MEEKREKTKSVKEVQLPKKKKIYYMSFILTEYIEINKFF